jgi:hypothetical protein
MSVEKDVRDYNNSVGFMSQHFVALACEYDTIENGRIKSSNTQIFSGWILDLHGQLFWVTAGHCLKEQLDEYITKGYIRVTGGGFMDYLGYRAEHIHRAPFTYELGCGFYIWDSEAGLDFALIPLSTLYRQYFESNNNIPIHQHRLSFDFYRVLGIPKDEVYRTQNPDGSHNVAVRPTMMAVEKITFEEAIAANLKCPPKTPEWFCARIHPEITNQTVVGMSGGPIYGFRRDDQGRLSYHVVALQSWWDPDKRIIFGCSVPKFAEGVYQAMQWEYNEFLTEQEEPAP